MSMILFPVIHPGMFSRLVCAGLSVSITVVSSLAVITGTAHAAATTAQLSNTNTGPTSMVLANSTAPAIEKRVLSFAKLTGQKTIPLRSTDGHTTLDFGIRRDEIVTHAKLSLRYTYSPALIPSQSHIKLSLNGETLGVILLTKEDAGKNLLYETEIDPRLMTDFNKLILNFIGHYAEQCEDPTHSSLWADISGNSEIALSVKKLAVASDLAILPEPFFDRRDSSRLIVNFVFGEKPQRETLQAAAVTASWFGKLATYRGTRFPVSLNTLPAGHAVVFAANNDRPAVLRDLPLATGPGIMVMTNPTDGISKLLVLLGRNSEDLQRAAESLALGNIAMSGTSVAVKESIKAAPRPAYDAPNWVRLDRPMRFAELVDSPQSLQTFGHEPAPIAINLRIPPDLFTWRTKGIPLDLKFRYSPPSRSSESRLTMRINNELVQAFNLSPNGQVGERTRIPVIEDGLLSNSQSVVIPAFKLGTRNTLQYNFSFTYLKESNCRDTQVDNISAMIDADSRIDFSGLPNFAEMPNLGFFATSGYPFTKFADLAQTVVVLPDQPTAQDIQTMLALMGRMSESTGVTATRVRVSGPNDEGALKDADLLVIGTAPQQTLLTKWAPSLPADVVGATKRISQSAGPMASLFDWFGISSQPGAVVISQENLVGSGPLAMLIGFESPLSASRSVVAVTASAPELMANVLDTLDDTNRSLSIHGSAVYIRGQQVDSILAGTVYTVGSLPFWASLWYAMSAHPMLLALAAIIAVLIFAFALWRGLKVVAERRTGGGE